MPGTTYTSRLDVLYNDNYGPGRELCTLTLHTVAPRLANGAVNIFEVRSSPNPFDYNFNLNINSSSEDCVSEVIYDVFGRLIEQYKKHVDQIENLSLGEWLPTGVYQVVVSQDQSTKTLRIIKR